MRELMRLVEVEVVNHIAVGKRVLREQVGDAGVVGPGGDDSVLWRGFADGGSGSGLNACPAVGITHFRLVHYFEEDEVVVAGGIVSRQRAPQHDKALDRSEEHTSELQSLR